jgi:hypothetical protein
MGLLLCLAVVGAVIATIATVQAFQRFQQTRHLVLMGDVRAIQPWMTIHHISIVYHVPEGYLYQELKIPRPETESLSLILLAGRYNRPVNELIHEVQAAILTYRKQHPRQGLHLLITKLPDSLSQEGRVVATLSNFIRIQYMNIFMVSP